MSETRQRKLSSALMREQSAITELRLLAASVRADAPRCARVAVSVAVKPRRHL
jgi:hypothetical protein